ncbi:MAG: 50S ribosomal protein L31 [Ardenticatenales bacterium]|jgi:large subunit ribosomal protein L31|nr:50S ribosomal protein L31 [Ardenticatenales bacterium]
MKADIHPQWFPEAQFVCRSCSMVYVVGATVATLNTEICANCHPFFTGEQRIVDTAGQVERFMRRLEVGQTQRLQQVKRVEAEAAREAAERDAKRRRRGLTPIVIAAEAEPEAAAETEPEAEPEAQG